MGSNIARAYAKEFHKRLLQPCHRERQRKSDTFGQLPLELKQVRGGYLYRTILVTGQQGFLLNCGASLQLSVRGRKITSSIIK